MMLKIREKTNMEEKNLLYIEILSFEVRNYKGDIQDKMDHESAPYIISYIWKKCNINTIIRDVQDMLSYVKNIPLVFMSV